MNGLDHYNEGWRVTVETPKSGAGDGKIVRRLDEYPELLEALRDGDLLTARMICAQLFDLDRRDVSIAKQQVGRSERLRD